MLRYSLLYMALLFCTMANGQDILSMEEAIAIAVENNYDLRIARNNTKIADVEASTLNSGYLPSLSAGGGINYSNEDQSVAFLDGTSTSIGGAITESYNASITAEYLIFDGLERKFGQDKNEENLTLAQLQERQQIENTVISIYENFFNVAYQKRVVENLGMNMVNSRDRLIRAQKQLKYGQGTKLDELNAQVDLNNDSIAHIEAMRDLNNLKRSLNLALGRKVTMDFKIDTTVTFGTKLQEQAILQSAEQYNIEMILARQNILLSELDIKINKARFLPKISGSGSYQWNESQNPPTSFALANESYGINLGLNLSWNIFDGGSATRVKTAKITKQNREIELVKIKDQLLTDILNAYETYTISQYTLNAESKNVDTNELNFERSQKQYGLGQITSVEYRQAQINLFNARNNYARAKYDVKIAEVNLLQLGGSLLN
ncbi:TolC family protein [Ulvibacterium sp.]|uniref:TolC family protein n=1 Tax=Ulvibacterium sp. TaxID=2665914 RepID=UPI002605BE6D|nr:TolC family protein [Ulvibacterium sp.]